MHKNRCLARSILVLGASAAALAHAQSYSPIFSLPGASGPLTLACYDQYGHAIPNAYFQVTTGAYDMSNAHYHGAGTEPVSTATPSSGYASPYTNWWSTTIYGTLVGQEEYITMKCTTDPAHGPWANGKLDYAVGYGDLAYTDSVYWVKIGGSDTGGGTNHGTTAYNRYMQVDFSGSTDPTRSSAYAFLDSTQTYMGLGYTGPFCANDMALFVGGKFDICNAPGISGCSGVTPWNSPHASHDRGTAVDVAGAGSAQCTNAGGVGVNINDFITACRNTTTGGHALASNTFNEGNHAHCGFTSITFPH